MFGSSDPDNPMGGLLGDLLKVIGSGPGAADSWFEAARTLAFGVATDGGEDENPDPLVRIAFEELARVAELHVVDATGIGPGSGARRGLLRGGRAGAVELPRARGLPARPQVDGRCATAGGGGGPVVDGPERARPGRVRRPRRTARAVRAHPGPGLPRHAVRLGRRAPGPPGVRAVRAPAAVARSTRRCSSSRSNVAGFADDWSLPLQEVQLWVCLRELTMHAVLTRPGVRASLMTLLGDASAHAAASQRSMVERLGDGLGDPAALEDALGDPEALLSDLISPEQRSISSALTAQTTAIGAYVDHITAGIAETLTSSPAALREAWYRYRIEEGKGEQAFAGLFGLNVGRDEVDRGRAFVSGVVERAGEDALARLWADELDLPTPAEVDAPGLWLARIGLLD